MKRILRKNIAIGCLGTLGLHFVSHGMVALEDDLGTWAYNTYRATVLKQANKLGFNLSMKMTPLTVNQVIAREIKVNQLSPAYGVIFKALISGESNGNSNAQSEEDARGLSQVHHTNASYCGYSKQELYEDEKNIICGVRLFAEALKNQGYNLILALKEYHGGADKHKWGKKTHAYPAYILSKLKELK